MKTPTWAAAMLPLLLVAQVNAQSTAASSRGGVSSTTTATAPAGTDAGLSAAKITLVKNVLNATANLSWEIGTHAEALTEFDYPSLSVFSPLAIPVPVYPYPSSVNALAAMILANKPAGILPLSSDTSAADPASQGPAILLANWTVISKMTPAYGKAAYDEIQYLLTQAPRTADGAISHRADYVQLWADFMYMVPPFLAYYGALTNNVTLMQEAYTQCKLYRNYLRDPSGLWRHIVMGPSGQDPGYWATGNAWAAAGMLRVMSTLMISQQSARFLNETIELASWTTEIVEASFTYQKSDSFFPNYFNRTTFSDAASTALMSASSYRLAQLSFGNSTIPHAEAARMAIYSGINATTGILTPVVDPLNYPQQGVESPEGQAFVLIMESAWRDWIAGGGVSTNETRPPRALAPSVVGTSASTSTAVIAAATATMVAPGLAQTLQSGLVLVMILAGALALV